MEEDKFSSPGSNSNSSGERRGRKRGTTLWHDIQIQHLTNTYFFYIKSLLEKPNNEKRQCEKIKTELSKLPAGERHICPTPQLRANAATLVSILLDYEKVKK